MDKRLRGRGRRTPEPRQSATDWHPVAIGVAISEPLFKASILAKKSLAMLPNGG